MSKWLRRGFGQNSNNPSQTDERPPVPEQTEFPSPPRNDIPPAAAAVAYPPQQPHTNSNNNGMAGYVAAAPVAMDVDQPTPPQQRSSKYSSSLQNGRNFESSRNRPRERTSSRDDRRNGSRSVSTNQFPQPRQQGATNAPPAPVPPPNGHFGQQNPASFGQQKQQAPLGTTTPPESVQPSFPPPAVTADTPPPSEAAQRRPAYLLHRDLVIGKGSYGQVCIASRGEPEGHSSGRSGKRKKFACKCVMLRNDPKYIAKLQEEVNVLRELRGHENVIRLFDVFCVDNELFIITELGRGGDLFHLLTTHPKHGVTEQYAGKSLKS